MGCRGGWRGGGVWGAVVGVFVSWRSGLGGGGPSWCVVGVGWMTCVVSAIGYGLPECLSELFQCDLFYERGEYRKRELALRLFLETIIR